MNSHWNARSPSSDRAGRILGSPLVAMVTGIALFVIAAQLGGIISSLLPLTTPTLKMLVRNALALAAVIVAYKLLVVRLGRTPHDDLQVRKAMPDLPVGLVLGFILMALSVGAAELVHVYRIVGEGDARDLVHALITSAIMPAFLEEILFRGIVFRFLEEAAGSWAALLVTSLLFGLAHVLNPGATPFSTVAVAIEAGVLLGGAYLLSRSLWLPIGIHGAWNFTQGEIFGVPVSGTAVHGLVSARLTGPTILSGGAFGLEASIIALLIATGAGAGMVAMAKRKGQLLPAPWHSGAR